MECSLFLRQAIFWNNRICSNSLRLYCLVLNSIMHNFFASKLFLAIPKHTFITYSTLNSTRIRLCFFHQISETLFPILFLVCSWYYTKSYQNFNKFRHFLVAPSKLNENLSLITNHENILKASVKWKSTC